MTKRNICQLSKEDNYAKFCSCFKHLPNMPSGIAFMERDDEYLEDQDDVVRLLPNNVMSMLEKLDTVIISKESVQPLDLTKFDERIEWVYRLLERFLKVFFHYLLPSTGRFLFS